MTGWEEQYAQAWAQTILRGLRTRFPWAAAHVSRAGDDCDVTPWLLHPGFHGCLDWHSSAHMQASAIVLLDEAGEHLAPQTREGLVAELDQRLTPAAMAVEAAYLLSHPGFERPYGWAWAAMLAARAARSRHPHAAAWQAALQPVADAVFANLVAWLPRLSYPVRTGVHDNTAFGLGLLHDAARVLGRQDVATAVERSARGFFLDDREAPVRWEPSGNDFLSPALCEAALMHRVLDGVEFAAWCTAFLPGLGSPGDPLLGVARVLDDTDGKAVHLHGLSLSRAWQLRRRAGASPAVLDPVATSRVTAAAQRQVAAVAPQVVAGDFMSTHWLVTFALMAVRTPELLA